MRLLNNVLSLQREVRFWWLSGSEGLLQCSLTLPLKHANLFQVVLRVTNWRRSMFYASVLLLMINCDRNIVKVVGEQRAAGTWVNFDNVMTKFIINKRKDVLKADVTLFLTISGPQNDQSPGINEWKRRRELAVNKDFIQNDATIVNSFSHFLICYLKSLQNILG